jgi:hypothetical protein
MLISKLESYACFAPNALQVFKCVLRQEKTLAAILEVSQPLHLARIINLLVPSREGHVL